MYDLKSWLDELHLGYIDDNLIWTALTHSSYKGMGYDVEDNERLEFLGDSVLDLINAEVLYQDENLSESEMTELRKIYVNNDQLAVIFNQLNMEQFIRIANNFKLSNKVKAGFIEALFGAIYAEKGYSECYNLWQLIQLKISSIDQDEKVTMNQNKMYDWIEQPFKSFLKNAKNTLQEFCQSHQFDLPKYQVIKKVGLEHEPIFTVEVIIRPGSNKIGFENVFNTYIIDNSFVSSTGKGKSKKIAEIKAAEKMCDIIGLLYTSEMML